MLPNVAEESSSPYGLIAVDALACLLSVSSLWWPSPPSDSVINEVFAVMGAVLATIASGIVAVLEPDPVVAIIAGLAATVSWVTVGWVYVNG